VDGALNVLTSVSTSLGMAQPLSPIARTEAAV